MLTALHVAFMDAEDEMRTFDSNNIENILQLSSLLDAIEIPLLAYAIYRHAKGGRPRQAIKSFFKILGDSYLFYRYGLAPTLKDAKLLVKDHAKILARVREGLFSQSFQWQVARGKYYGNHPTTEYFRRAFELECRTKCIYKLNDASFFQIIGMFDAVGVLPNSSRIWDLIPWSVFVDWFLNMGNTLGVMDAFAKGFIAYDISSIVGSFRMSFPIEQGWLPDGTMLADDGSGPPDAILYDRFVLKSLPLPTGSSVYSFQPPQGPDYKIIGALLLSKAGSK
jgi:hypothetical protein